MLHIPGLYIIETLNKGRGVFTSEKLTEGDLIEICPLIKIPQGQLSTIHETILHDYYFIWEEPEIEAVIALGYGSLYNHSQEPNATVVMDYSDNTIKIEAIQKIKSGMEITIDYTGSTKGLVDLWFSPSKS